MSSIHVNDDEFIWAEKYRPKKLSDVIIPEELTKEFEEYIKKGEIPNLIFSSPSPGTGKTTCARVLCDEIGSNYMFINASNETSIDVVRTKVTQYATTMSVDGSRKVIILDEIDRMSPQAQDSLKGILEEVSKNCRFLLTTNHIAKIIDPLKVSRAPIINFTFSKKDLIQIATKMFARVKEILTLEGVTYDNDALMTFIAKSLPDNRGLLNNLQRYATAHGHIDVGVLSELNRNDSERLIEAMKKKNYGQVLQWVTDNHDRVGTDFYGHIYKKLRDIVKPEAIPQMILTINEFQRYHSVPDRLVHFAALATNIMIDLDGQWI